MHACVSGTLDDATASDIEMPPYYHAPDVSEGKNRMRGADEQTSHMFSYPLPEQRVQPDHPLRAIRRMTDEVFASLSARLWEVADLVALLEAAESKAA
jgi:hypothetical protein